MRDLIRKILLEHDTLPKVDREERIREIERRFDYINQLVPSFIKFYQKIYKKELEKVDVDVKKIFYGNEQYSGKEIVLKLYFSDSIDTDGLRREIWDYMEKVFGIDMQIYGMPLLVEVYIKKYERI